MVTTLDVDPVRAEDADTLRRLIELYAYDFSEFNHADLGPDGRYADYPYFDAIWTDADRAVFAAFPGAGQTRQHFVIS